MVLLLLILTLVIRHKDLLDLRLFRRRGRRSTIRVRCRWIRTRCASAVVPHTALGVVRHIRDENADTVPHSAPPPTLGAISEPQTLSALQVAAGAAQPQKPSPRRLPNEAMSVDGGAIIFDPKVNGGMAAGGQVDAACQPHPPQSDGGLFGNRRAEPPRPASTPSVAAVHDDASAVRNRWNAWRRGYRKGGDADVERYLQDLQA